MGGVDYPAKGGFCKIAPRYRAECDSLWQVSRHMSCSGETNGLKTSAFYVCVTRAQRVVFVTLSLNNLDSVTITT